MAWKLEKRSTSKDGWWLRSIAPTAADGKAVLGSRLNPFESEYDASLAGKEGEHPQFVRSNVAVDVYVDEQTGAVHTAELDENGDPIPPGDEVEPFSGRDLSILPLPPRDQLQQEMGRLNQRLTELEAE